MSQFGVKGTAAARIKVRKNFVRGSQCHGLLGRTRRCREANAARFMAGVDAVDGIEDRGVEQVAQRQAWRLTFLRGDSDPSPGFVFHSLKPLTIPPAC